MEAETLKHKLESLLPSQWLSHWIDSLQWNEFWTSATALILDLALLVVICLALQILTRRVLLAIAHSLFNRTKATWDDHFIQQRVFRNAAHFFPVIAVLILLPAILVDYPALVNFLMKVLNIYLVVLGAIVLNKVLRAMMRYVEEEPRFIGKPHKTILQVFQVVLFFVAAVVVLSMVIGIKVSTMLGAMVGTTAILILIFQDTINGLLANFQISMYDLVVKGDWVTFEKFGVDGVVTSIDLTTVKIQNWDKTISTVPAKAFVNDSFVNWRGMTDNKIRRIKRNILIDINSISFCTDEMLEKYSKYQLITDYIHHRQSDITAINEKNGIDLNGPAINGRRQTNIGVFRAYVERYLKNHSAISKSPNASIMVRQLQPTPEGVMLEVYCFSSDIVWANYESIQADIFDHLFAAAAFFDLRLYQAPSGKDFQRLNARAEA